MSARSGTAGVLGVVLILLVSGAFGSIAITGTVAAQEPVVVDSDISSDTTWEAGTGPYRVVKTVTVGSDATLSIQSGVTVEVAEGASIVVDGDIDVQGSAEDPVVFTSSKPSPQPGSWGTIELQGPYSRSFVFRHAEIEYATTGLTLTGGQRLLLEHVEIGNSSEAGIAGLASDGYAASGDVTIRDSSIHDNRIGIDGTDERYTIERTTITRNTKSGLKQFHDLNIVDLTIRDSTITRNDVGVSLESRVDQHNRGGEITGVVVENSTVSSNAGMGIRVFGDHLGDIRVIDTQVQSNGGSGLHLQDTGKSGGSKASGQITVRGSTVTENGNRGLYIDGAYSSLSDIDVSTTRFSENGAPGLRIEADRSISKTNLTDLTARWNGADGIAVVGTGTDGVVLSGLDALGNGGTGLHLDGGALAGLTVEDSRSSMNGEAGVVVNGSSEGFGSALSGLTVAGNERGVVVSNHATEITRTRIEYNNGTGIVFERAGARPSLLTKTDVYGNGVGLNVSASAETVLADVTDVYWGASSGPHHDSVNPEGEGQPVEGSLETVTFIPYAESAHHPQNDRPTAHLSVSETNVTLGSTVTLDGSQSADDGEVQWYRYSVNTSGSTGFVQDSEVGHEFTTEGVHEISLQVVDDHGAPSAENATVTVTVTNESATTSDGGGDSNHAGNGNGGSDGSDGADGSDDGDEDSGVRVPGFGMAVAVIGMLTALVAWTRFARR